MNHYGGRCACCGINDLDVLSIDHINGGGRKQHQKEGPLRYNKLRRQGYPEGYQVLCMNCNQAKGIYGLCPHHQ